jgi:ABC-type proline/glycine betaine transport system permease subunit
VLVDAAGRAQGVLVAGMNWVVNNLDLIGGLTLAHLRQSAIAIVAAFVIALPLGWVAWRYTALRGSVLTTIGLLYTIPSLGLFACCGRSSAPTCRRTTSSSR